MPASPPLKQPVLFLLLLCGASLACYWTRLPETDAARMNDPSLIRGRALTNLYPRWYGAREALLHHRDPYSAEVTREIQLAYDGKEQRFSYPLYAILFVTPIIGLPFHSAQIVFWWLLAAVTGLSLALWLSVIPCRLSLFARVTLFAMVFCSVPVLQGLSLLQFGLLVAALLSGSVAAVVAGHLFLAGMLLALATIKPPMSLFAICWFAVWTTGDWRRRWPLLQGFATALVVLIVASECLVPGWVFRYPGILATYAKNAAPAPLISVFLPPSWVWPVALGGLVGTALYCWRVPANLRVPLLHTRPRLRVNAGSSDYPDSTIALQSSLTVACSPAHTSSLDEALVAGYSLSRRDLVACRDCASSLAARSSCDGCFAGASAGLAHELQARSTLCQSLTSLRGSRPSVPSRQRALFHVSHE